jgi:hypothetical protein
VLVLVLSTEMFLGVVVVALPAGLVLLAFGIALDACARALGTIAAARGGSRAWAWGCVAVGSPAVIVFALSKGSDQVPVEPAPLASLLSLLAGLIIAIAVAAWALGA